MAFVVENGTGLVNSNSYVSVAGADTILEQNPDRKEWICRSPQEREVTLRFATAWLDTKYRWFGDVFNPSAPQALQWPRTKNTDDKGQEIPGGTVPSQLEKATTLIALEVAKASSIASGAEDLTPSIEASGSIKSFQIETLSITFDQGDQTSGGGLFREWTGKRFPQVESLLHSIGELRGLTDQMENL